MGRDKLNDTQGTGTRFPRIEVDQRIQVKEQLPGNPVFRYWDKNKGESGDNVFFDGPIKGILIGAVNTIGTFDQAYGRNGGAYNSSYFLTNKDKIVIFDPAGNKCFAGTRDQVDSYAAQMGLEKFGSKKRLLVLTEKGIMLDIETNIILFISQINNHDKDTFKDYLITLTPAEFDIDINPINANAKTIKFLGPFAKKNKAKYAHIDKGEALTDELWDKYGVPGAADKAADMYIEWAKALNAGREDEGETVQENYTGAPGPPPDDLHQPPPEGSLPPEPEDDQPF